MGALINFVNWFWRLLSKSVVLLFNLPFQIGLAIGGCVAAVATMFSHFSFFSSATSCINELTRSAHTVIDSYGGSNAAYIFLGWFSFGRLVQVVGGVISLTRGVTAVVFVTMLVSTLSVLTVAYTVRGVQKAIQICSAGLIDT